MFIEKEYLEAWMRRILERFDILEKHLTKEPEKETEKERLTLDGEILLDNQDLCFLLKVSNRSLQRYRSLGWLQYEQIDQKIYYKKSEVERFTREYFSKRRLKRKNRGND